MKIKLILLAALALLSTLNPQLNTAFAQGTAFTYQGRLDDGGTNANGNYDLTFTLFANSSGAAQIGGTLTNSAVGVSNGLFNVVLDFGAGVFTGEDRWLEIGVRTNGGGAFTNLAPRQQMTSTPYAVRAANFSGAVSEGQLSANVARLNANQTFGGAVNFSNGASSFAGSFSGNGAGLAGVSLGLLNAPGLFTWAGFALATSPQVGNGPVSVAAADVNGDGRMDLISANQGADTLTVLTNNGYGNFRLCSSPGVGSAPSSVVTADVNGDGRPDLICANSYDSTLSVLTNKGSGGFVLSSTPGVGDYPLSVTAADVNGDGKPDLISANYSTNTLTVLTNNGSGGFVLSSSPAVGDGPRSVVAADMNGDGWVDLISADYRYYSASVLTNDGSGGFVLAVQLDTPGRIFSVAVPDVNGDGRPDLVTGDLTFNWLNVWTNNGHLGFGYSSSPVVGNLPYSVVAADVNRDGKPDLISANADDATLSVLTNNGSGGFVLYATPNQGTYPNLLIAADVTGDGWLDLVTANPNGGTLSVWASKLKFGGSFSGNFTGSGAGLIPLNAASLFGRVSDARLSANVAMLHSNQTFTGPKTFSDAGNVYKGSGVGLNSLDADDFSSGTLNDARLSANVGRLNASQTFSADKTFGSGAQLFVDTGTNTAPGLSFNGDSDTGIFSPGANQIAFANGGIETLRVMANGRFGIGTNNPQSALHVVGTVTATSFNSSSDRNLKENIAPVNPCEVLNRVVALPVSRWNFIGDAATPHVGPMAQDFHAAFGLGTDDRHIATVDADGVVLSAIQGLNLKLEAEKVRRREELKRDEAGSAELEQRLAALEKNIHN